MNIASSRYFLWGTGKIGTKIVREFRETLSKIDIVGFVDNNLDKTNSLFYGYRVFSPNELINYSNIRVILCIADTKDVILQIRELCPKADIIDDAKMYFTMLSKLLEENLDYEIPLLRKKSVVVGGTSGIGYAIAKQLLKDGADVVVTGSNKDKGEKIILDTPSLKYVQWNIEDLSKMGRKIDEIEEKLEGQIDILVYCAGVLFENDFHCDFWSVSENEWDSTMNINVKGMFFVCQEISKRMINKNIYGHILNICSEMGIRPIWNPYGISKWGTVGLTKGLGKMLAPYGITVNGIAPGAINTSMMRWNSMDSIYRKSHPNKRYGFPEEIARLASFLVSDKGNNIVGEVIVCDGGSSLR